MKIRNKDRLVNRAKAHRAADRFIQGSYFRVHSPGWNDDIPRDDFKGCEIGCLSMPVKPSAIKRVLKSKGEPLYAGTAVERIEKDFGVHRGLQRIAEGIFESKGDLDSAADFVVRFTEALPEGREVTFRLIFAWLCSVGAADPDEFDEYLADDAGDEIGLEHERRFLDWLRRGAPWPRAVSKTLALA